MILVSDDKRADARNQSSVCSEFDFEYDEVIKPGKPFTLACERPMTGRYVTIKRQFSSNFTSLGGSELYLCDVSITGEDPNGISMYMEKPMALLVKKLILKVGLT